MATNITSKFLAGTGVIVTTQGMTRVMAIHAYSTVVGTCALSDSTGAVSYTHLTLPTTPYV